MTDKAGLYLVDIDVDCEGILGGPRLALNLMVNAPEGKVYGSGEISQSGTAPGSEGHKIPAISGHIYHTGFGQDTMLVSLRGRYAIPFGPTMPGQTEGMMIAALALDSSWEGGGTFHYGANGDQVCARARVSRHQK
jgi:hypothetical protein